MKQNQIPDSTVTKLKSTNFANIFNIYLNEDNRYIYNLLNTVTIPDALNRTLYDVIYPLPKEYLTQFSFRVYKTIDLAWLIAETNNITNMLEPLDPSKPLRVLNDVVVRDILLKIRTIT